jgi:hypothetical protein
MHTDMQYIQDDLCKSLLSSASGLMSSLKEVVISSSWFMKLLKSEKFVDVLFEPCNSLCALFLLRRLLFDFFETGINRGGM